MQIMEIYIKESMQKSHQNSPNLFYFVINPSTLSWISTRCQRNREGKLGKQISALYK